MKRKSIKVLIDNLVEAVQDIDVYAVRNGGNVDPDLMKAYRLARREIREELLKAKKNEKSR